MQSLLALHSQHEALGGQFVSVAGSEVVARYGNPNVECHALTHTAGLLDLSFRSRLCLLGADRKKFLHGQVTNDVNGLQPGKGCYAALVSAKGKMQSDLFVYCLQDELLLDFEPGLTESVAQRLEKYIIADDVQVVPVADAYGLLSIQGPRSAEVVKAALPSEVELPSIPFDTLKIQHAEWGEVYLMNQPRWLRPGFDLFAPTASLSLLWDRLVTCILQVQGSVVGWEAAERVRTEGTIPRFGCDMDETILPPEAGLESRAVHYAKGCYIGQEVLARIRTYGQVAKALRGIQFASGTQVPVKRGDKVYWSDKEIGYVTSVQYSPTLRSNVALSFLRREHNQLGVDLLVQTDSGRFPAKVVTLPFQSFPISPLDPTS